MKRAPAKNATAQHAVDDPSRALSFMRLLWALAHGLESASKHMFATLGVTGPQRLVLRLVGHHGSASAGDLARMLHVHPSSLTGVLRRLERAGLLRRGRDPNDGRKAVLTLTPSGKRLNARRRGTVESIVDQVLRAATPGDVQTAERLLHRLAAAFDEKHRG